MLPYGCLLAGICLGTVASTTGIHYLLTRQWVSVEWGAAIGLLSLNVLFSIGMMSRKGPKLLGGPLGFGLFLIGTKLFVNTLTILLLIGLQAVQTPVFVPVFFVGYFVWLLLTILALHRTS